MKAHVSHLRIPESKNTEISGSCFKNCHTGSFATKSALARLVTIGVAAANNIAIIAKTINNSVNENAHLYLILILDILRHNTI